MKVNGNTITAEEGLVLRRISDKEIFGERMTLGKVYYIGGELIEDGHQETPEEYEEGLQVGSMWFVPEEACKLNLSSKEALQESLIRLKYSEREEINLIRNQSDGFEDYKKWCSQVEEAISTISFEETSSLEKAKEAKIQQITLYDSSTAVNSFTYSGMTFWLDKDTRVGLVNSTNIAKTLGKEVTTLWLGSMSLTIPCDAVLNILYAVEMYALECYNVTASHKAAVQAMTDIEDIKVYDYTKGYPKKLIFS